MKKSQILKVLDGSVKKYWILSDDNGSEQFLHVQVRALNWLQLTFINEEILHILPLDSKGIEIIFCSDVIID